MANTINKKQRLHEQKKKKQNWLERLVKKLK